VKQLVQHLRSGVLELMDVPCPQPARGQLLIQSRASLISAGTERFLVEFGQASLWQKARQNPDRVKQVWNKIKTDGLMPTLEAVFAKLDDPLPLGYCNVGRVLEAGPGVRGYAPGDRVVSNGAHAEVVLVPQNLCAAIPDNVTDEQASFTVLSAIGLQGIRLLNPGLGETVAVFGLGLIGLLSVQMLVNSGARVLGIDVDPARLELAKSFGAEVVNAKSGDPVAAAMNMSGGHGVDGVLITASAKEDEIVSQSANMSRKRGKIVLVGVVDLELNRAEWYKKELSFQVSCSYGPGRYDPTYEEQGHDYPLPFVRWTEQRNIAAVLDQLSRGRLKVEQLISSRLPHLDAQQAYKLLTSDRQQLGIVLSYPEETHARESQIDLSSANGTTRPKQPALAKGTGSARVGLIGSGSFATHVLLPAIKKTNVPLVTVASARGLTAAHAARKYGFAGSTSDVPALLADPAINTVFITTRSNLHAAQVVAALDAGKHVFVEKPLATDAAGLAAVIEAHRRQPNLQLMTGFNRRFSPHAKTLRQWLKTRSEPATLQMTINAGQLAPEHWSANLEQSGGRIVGEGCHWFDLLSFLVGSPIVRVSSNSAGSADPSQGHQTITLTLADGSVGTIQYLVNGHKSFPKERLVVFCQGQVAELDNFRRLRGFGCRGFSKQNLWRQDKGHTDEVAAFLGAVTRSSPQVIPVAQQVNVTRATFAALESAATGKTIEVEPFE
jgi:predicted dehydrogenase/threonine dehydrogenase-like Zn-dependent dehydrogenase